MDDDASLYLAKATESLLTAESEFIDGRYNSCANRCYYACFQAAIAALLREGIRPRGNWGLDFVRGSSSANSLSGANDTAATFGAFSQLTRTSAIRLIINLSR